MRPRTENQVQSPSLCRGWNFISRTWGTWQGKYPRTHTTERQNHRAARQSLCGRNQGSRPLGGSSRRDESVSMSDFEDMATQLEMISKDISKWQREVFWDVFVLFFKSLLNLLQYYFCFTFWFFDHEACGILTLQPGLEPDSRTAPPPQRTF